MTSLEFSLFESQFNYEINEFDVVNYSIIKLCTLKENKLPIRNFFYRSDSWVFEGEVKWRKLQSTIFCIIIITTTK
jgi:hypothetical protein